VQTPAPAVPTLLAPSLHIIIAHVIVLSVALERVIEILKGILPFWPFAGARSRLRSAALIVITAGIGSGFCWFFHLNLLHVEHVRSGYIAVGLAAAAGAAFWNNLLGLMRASRILKESQAVSGK
jgi:hypothetical protein